MKKSISLLALSICFGGFMMAGYAQVVLPDVVVKTVNYKYLKSVSDTTTAQPVRLLEHRAAAYDIRSSDMYEDEYDSYSVSFYLPQGLILATYDQDGKLVRTAERFKNVALPPAVRSAVAERFPQWGFSKDTYLVNYFDDEGAKKVYKLVLENGNKRLRIRTNEAGEFLK